MANDTKTIGQIIGSRMRQQRQALGLTQEQVGELSGVPQASISRLEREESEDIQVSTVLELARALRLTVEDLVGMTPEEYAKAKRPTRRGRRKISALDLMTPSETNTKAKPKAPAPKRTRTPAKAAKG